MFNGKRRIFADHLIEHFGHAAFVTTLSGAHRQTEHRFREVELLHVDAAFDGAVVEDAAVGNIFHFSHSTDVAGVHFIDFQAFFALKHDGTSDLEGFLAVIDIQG